MVEESKTSKEKNRDNVNRYYQEHRDEILKKRNEKHICNICGGRYTSANRSKHLKSQKHNTIANLKNQLDAIQTNN